MKYLPSILVGFYILLGILLPLKAVINYQVKHVTFLSPKADTLGISEYKRETKKVIYGFLPYWMLDKTEYIQLDKLTHVAYFALGINSNGTIKKLAEDGTTDPGYNRWKNSKALKEFIASAKAQNVEIAITLISHEDDANDKFLNCQPCWETLYKEVDKELKDNELKSLNLDIEYVGDTTKEMALKYSAFVDFMNKKLDKSNPKTGVEVIVSSYADAVKKTRVTDIASLNKAADGIFIMAYDFHYSESDTAGPVSPINGAGGNYAYDLTSMLNDYLKKTTASKIILGVPYYGYNWVVSSYTPYSTRIPGDDYIGYSQSQTYEYIMDTLISLKPNVLWDANALVPHFSYVSPTTGSIRQVYFENSDSLKIKYDLVNNYNLRGAGIWALGYDGGYQELWQILEEKFGATNPTSSLTLVN